MGLRVKWSFHPPLSCKIFSLFSVVCSRSKHSFTVCWILNRVWRCVIYKITFSQCAVNKFTYSFTCSAPRRQLKRRRAVVPWRAARPGNSGMRACSARGGHRTRPDRRCQAVVFMAGSCCVVIRPAGGRAGQGEGPCASRSFGWIRTGPRGLIAAALALAAAVGARRDRG